MSYSFSFLSADIACRTRQELLISVRPQKCRGSHFILHNWKKHFKDCCPPLLLVEVTETIAISYSQISVVTKAAVHVQARCVHSGDACFEIFCPSCTFFIETHCASFQILSIVHIPSSPFQLKVATSWQFFQTTCLISI